MVKLNNINIDFDCNKETPYFQVNSVHRIRFGMENINIPLIRKIVQNVFKENDNLSVIFVSEYIKNNKRYSSNSRVGKIIEIKNWNETVVNDDSIGEGVVYATIKNLNRNDLIKYCTKIYQGNSEAYISFFNDQYLLYVSSNVVDIISNNIQVISNLKQNYFEQFNKYYENENF